MKNFLGYVIFSLFFACLPQITHGGIYNDISQELDSINQNRGNRVSSLSRLETLRTQFNTQEEFETTVAPLKSQISKVANTIIDFPSCFCGSCAIGSILQCGDIDKAFAFLSHWPVQKEDLDQSENPFSGQKVHQLRMGMRLALTFPDLLDFNKAQPLVPYLNAKFGEAEPFDLSKVPGYQKFFLKVAVRSLDQISKNWYIITGGITCAIGYLFYTGAQEILFFNFEKF